MTRWILRILYRRDLYPLIFKNQHVMRSPFSVRTLTSFSPIAAALFAAASSNFSSAERPRP